MNYYEELGIARDASAGKIRQAYKMLARLVHPDAHSDEALKETAERQMRRLNAMLETLLDAEQRRAYDASLLEGDRGRRPPAGEVGRRYLHLCWRLQVIRERTALAAGARRLDGWPSVMRAALRRWF
jgi:curved DNA-binding protein CbpA